MASENKIGRSPKLSFAPLTIDRWDDMEELFGPRGACGGCWCMHWRLTHSEFERDKGDKNRRAMMALVKSGDVPGIMAYESAEPVAWCSVAPRESFTRLDRSRILKPVDDEPVWSVVCFFIAKRARKRGVSLAILNAATSYAAEQGAEIVEGYPVEPKKGKTADVFAYTGLASVFRKAGYEEVIRRSETRPIMRLRLGAENKKRGRKDHSK
jgi:GNAT superfamily N-acetyltransferase